MLFSTRTLIPTTPAIRHLSVASQLFNGLALGLDFEFPQKATNELDNSECFSIKNGLDLRPREYKITV